MDQRRGRLVNDEGFLRKITDVVGSGRVSRDPDVLRRYGADESFATPNPPSVVVWPTTTEQVRTIVGLAGEHGVPLVPVSSGGGGRLNGDTVPRVSGACVVDLSKMNRVLHVDAKNRVVMVEPGVTFERLAQELKRHGLRPLWPLQPRRDKSALTAALERVPTTIPRYHWDALDPLLCVEVVFGTGDVFRTGSAAGPGTVEEQRAAGQVQKNPMGPTQFTITRTLQGAAGTLGIVTWATLKCELAPSLREVRFFAANDDAFSDLVDFVGEVLKYRIGDEVFLLNAPALARLVETAPEKFPPEFVVPVVLSGRGQFAADRVEYLLGDLSDLAAKHPGVRADATFGEVDAGRFLDALDRTCDGNWPARGGGFQPVFFLTTLDKVVDHWDATRAFLGERAPGLPPAGLYVQPVVQGSSCHFEVQVYYDPEDAERASEAKAAFEGLSQVLADEGAFFSRPYGSWASLAFERLRPEGVKLLNGVKRILDPANVLNPGALCFDAEVGHQ
ncbi:MAG: FAD-linked oxidase C-terminal domain-containing protein [Promethearchaeota archaeon]